MERVREVNFLNQSDFMQLIGLIMGNFKLLEKKISDLDAKIMHYEAERHQERLKNQLLDLEVKEIKIKITSIEIAISKKISSCFLKIQENIAKAIALEEKINSLEKDCCDKIIANAEQIRFLNARFQKHYHQIWLKGMPAPAATFGPLF